MLHEAPKHIDMGLHLQERLRRAPENGCRLYTAATSALGGLAAWHWRAASKYRFRQTLPIQLQFAAFLPRKSLEDCGVFGLL